MLTGRSCAVEDSASRSRLPAGTLAAQSVQGSGPGRQPGPTGGSSAGPRRRKSSTATTRANALLDRPLDLRSVEDRASRSRLPAGTLQRNRFGFRSRPAAGTLAAQSIQGSGPGRQPGPSGGAPPGPGFEVFLGDDEANARSTGVRSRWKTASRSRLPAGTLAAQSVQGSGPGRQPGPTAELRWNPERRSFPATRGQRELRDRPLLAPWKLGSVGPGCRPGPWQRNRFRVQVPAGSRDLPRKLRWNREKEVFLGDDEANALLDRPMRAPWKLPSRSRLPAGTLRRNRFRVQVPAGSRDLPAEAPLGPGEGSLPRRRGPTPCSTGRCLRRGSRLVGPGCRPGPWRRNRFGVQVPAGSRDLPAEAPLGPGERGLPRRRRGQRPARPADACAVEVGLNPIPFNGATVLARLTAWRLDAYARCAV